MGLSPKPSTLNPEPCTAFGVAPLLHMVRGVYIVRACVYVFVFQVCEELLVSAHEEGENHVWWVDIQVCVCLCVCLLLLYLCL